MASQQNANNEPLLTGQAQYFPQNQEPRTFFHFEERSELMHYITSVRWFSLKWFTIMRGLIFALFIASTPLLILAHIKLPKNDTIHTITTPHFFLTPYWILHCAWLLFYSIVLISAFKNRIVLKQIHEYTQRLDPIKTNNWLRFAHFLFQILITLSPIFYVSEIIFAPKEQVAHAIPNGLYIIFVGVVILLELITNNISLLWPHIIFTYLAPVPYYITFFVLYAKTNFHVQAHWFQPWNRDTSKIILLLPTICGFIAGLNIALLTFVVWRQLRWCKKQRKKEEHQNAVYFFGTSELGTRLKLNTGVNYHVETSVSPAV